MTSGCEGGWGDGERGERLREAASVHTAPAATVVTPIEGTRRCVSVYLCRTLPLLLYALCVLVGFNFSHP